MRKPVVWVILMAALLAIAYLAYRSRHNPRNLNVEPHAAREIEKAKKR